MADVINIISFEIKSSVNTPDYTMEDGKYYDNGNWKELHKIRQLPSCESKYWTWDGKDVVEMSDEDKAAVDYIPPPPELTPEQIAQKAADVRRYSIKTDIEEIYPFRSDELQEIRTILAEEFPNNERAQLYNSNIEYILSKYPKE